MHFSKILILYAAFTLCCIQVYCADLSGYVTDTNNKPLPFANIIIKGTTLGYTTNEKGFYSIKLAEGSYTLIFQYIGYKKKEVPITLEGKATQLNIQLEIDIQELNAIIVKATDEDPAYRIIKKAIENREMHLKENTSFVCDVYIKELQKLVDAPDKILGVELHTVLDVDSNNTGIIYLSESASKLYTQYPNNSKEIMYASKVSGDDQQFSWNDAKSMTLNFYENLTNFQNINERGFVSPIANNALFFYDYRLIGTYKENNEIINKIEVIPKRKSDPVFTGDIYITDNDYRIYAAHLQLYKSNGLDFIDTFTVEQEYINITDSVWMLLSNKFNFTYSFLGIKGKGYANAFYKNYELNPVLPNNFFNGEVSKIEEGSNKKDTVYWNDLRPVNLSPEEITDYHQKDSLYTIKKTPEYIDSTDRIFNKFSIGKIITGYTYRNLNKNIFIKTNAIYNLLQYNTIEGWVISPELNYVKNYKNNTSFILRPSLRYSAATSDISPALFANCTYNALQSANVMVHGGVEMAQFNPYGVTPLVNTVNTLLLEKNFLKIYRKYFLSLGYSKELFNGFYFTANTEYAERKQLYDLAAPNSWIDFDGRDFYANNFPFISDSSELYLPDKFTIGIQLNYTIKQQYMTEPGNKYILPSQYPQLSFKYIKAIPRFIHSEAKYDYVEFGISDKLKIGLIGSLNYSLRAGNFLFKENISAADETHFAGNETIFMGLNTNSYFSLPYYLMSTSNAFFEARLTYHTEGFLFNKLPVFKQFKLQPVFGFNYLAVDNGLKNYVEFSAGIEHVFKIIRIDVAYTPYPFAEIYPAGQTWKILFGFGF